MIRQFHDPGEDVYDSDHLLGLLVPGRHVHRQNILVNCVDLGQVLWICHHDTTTLHRTHIPLVCRIAEPGLTGPVVLLHLGHRVSISQVGSQEPHTDTDTSVPPTSSHKVKATAVLLSQVLQ